MRGDVSRFALQENHADSRVKHQLKEDNSRGREIAKNIVVLLKQDDKDHTIFGGYFDVEGAEEKGTAHKLADSWVFSMG